MKLNKLIIIGIIDEHNNIDSLPVYYRAPINHSDIREWKNIKRLWRWFPKIGFVESSHSTPLLEDEKEDILKHLKQEYNIEKI